MNQQIGKPVDIQSDVEHTIPQYVLGKNNNLPINLVHFVDLVFFLSTIRNRKRSSA